MNQNIQYRLLSFFLALIILCSSFYQAYVSVYFIAYQDYIIKELCVQKDNQQGCNGKCYLMKKLNTEVSENNATIPSQKENDFRGNFIFFLEKKPNISFKYIADSNLEKSEYMSLSNESLFIDKETPPPKYLI